jgi:hypothetical protein
MPGRLHRIAAGAALLGLLSASVATASFAQTLPVVSLTATDRVGSEPGTNTAAFTVTRTGDTTAALAVNYSVGGSATSGVDYTALPGAVTIPAGSTSALITVTPLDDLLVEGTETVVATLTAAGTYTVGSPASATVRIRDNDGAVDDDEGPGAREFGSRPGWGWGDQNHEHFGPPGHGCSATDSCLDEDGGVASAVHTDDDDHEVHGQRHGRGHGGPSANRGRGRGRD